MSLALAACAGRPTEDLLSNHILPAQQSQIADTHRIYVATTRARASRNAELYTGDRASQLSYARVDVSVPAIHKTGEIEYPKLGPRDPAKYFTATSAATYPQEEGIVAELAESIRKDGGRALVFVHGYNTRFDEAVYRLTQFVQDADYPGAPVLFTWASGGRVVDYIYDRDSSTLARDGLERTLRMVRKAGAKRIDIIAHSMGNWVTLEALRQLAITGDRDLGGRLGDVILASPDVDVDIFKSQMRRYGVPDKPFFVLLSGDDRALNVSGLIAGNRPRLGRYEDAGDIAAYGVTVVNVTNVEAGDMANHTKFADNPVLVTLIGDRLRRGDNLAQEEDDLGNHIEQLARGIGQTAFSAASIVITTPAALVGAAVSPR
ncbi:alpha/beta hydrolase [Mesorhizobium xinjiangense]|uniref:alpha/beta hydrolase n=1 Tax=Mesorhizobium xinjiangense TaxID=2678685 RepID=UPI0012ECFC5A